MAKRLLEADGLVDEADRAEAEADRLRELLARLEWAGTHCERGRELAACPVCDVVADSEVVGQLPHVNCWLAAELRTERHAAADNQAPTSSAGSPRERRNRPPAGKTKGRLA